jgi:hypothetical protein
MKRKTYNVIISLARAEDAEGSFARDVHEVVRDVRVQVGGPRYQVSGRSGRARDAEALAIDEAVALQGVPAAKRVVRRVVVKPHVIKIGQVDVVAAEEVTSGAVRIARPRPRGVARERVRPSA